ncbi:SCO2524 family protein [Sphaerisporangium sp. TRM90804]|uniref:SCO2524 family protein n=1 Tax=Sphaerisporangium sp. TRM90804 TaxID=3031113 RepID=UPI002449CD92|nr:SCO2524 family protein [Sphaerisporangium sp. TRM90804]MDH2424335.1 SCO2524 family protein [Sphaerisporangium sp. TRM90804]
MKLQPRQQLLEVWEAAARASFRDGTWVWGGRDGSNSISDAEQLLCFVHPAAELSGFKLDVPDATADDVLEALSELGDSVEIPKLLLRVIGEYLRTYADPDGRPVFSGGGYFKSTEEGVEATPEQRQLDMVDSFSISVTLMLGVLGFLKVFRQSVRREDIRREIRELEQLSSKRLSAAMVGLLRSFTVNVFEPGSLAGQTLLRTVNQTGAPERRIQEDLQKRLLEVRAGVRELTIGSGVVDLDNPNLLFECGWSWGLVKDAPQVETILDVGTQPKGVAVQTPFMYFTVNALVGIVDLFSERTRVLGLLDDAQFQLAQALQRRWDLTQGYWRVIATYGRGLWPLQDIPWRTSDGRESDYYSLAVTAMVVQSLLSNRAADVDVGRVTGVLEELAIRARITRRAIAGDPPVALHSPGITVTLAGTEDIGPQLTWQVADFSIILLKRINWLSSITQSTRTRERLLDLADQVWQHVLSRRCGHGLARGLWDHPGNVYSDIDDHHELPSWYFSERVVEFLVSAAKSSAESPLRSPQLMDIARDMLSEAEHLLDQELVTRPLLAGPAIRSSLRGVQAGLSRARLILGERPATAVALISDALVELERLATARENAAEVT